MIGVAIIIIFSWLSGACAVIALVFLVRKDKLQAALGFLFSFGCLLIAASEWVRQ